MSSNRISNTRARLAVPKNLKADYRERVEDRTAKSCWRYNKKRYKLTREWRTPFRQRNGF